MLKANGNTEKLYETLANLRLTIGYLGEREQFGWWQSSFFTRGSDAFLSPLFSRTQILAQCNGVTQAAARIHDERIGIGHVYHLFRLPEDIEQHIHTILRETTQLSVVENKETALNYLRQFASNPKTASLGPTMVGDKITLTELESWSRASGFYLDAFERGVEIYPYFVEKS
jgi:hypothetical protein